MNEPGGIFGASQCVGDTCLSAQASARQVPAVCRGAFGSFCRALVVAHIANFETRSRHLQNTCVVLRVCTLRLVSFLFGSCRLALKAPGQVRKFPNEFAECVSGCMMPTADHMVRAYYRAMLMRAAWMRTRMHVYVLEAGGTHGAPPIPPRIPPRACRCSRFSGVS